MPSSQRRLHHLDRLDLEPDHVPTGRRQLEHVAPKLPLHRPPIDPHELCAPLVEVRAQRATRPQNLNPRWSSSEERQRRASVETILRQSSSDRATYGWSSSDERQRGAGVETTAACRLRPSRNRRRPNERPGKDSDNKSPHAQPPSAQRPNSVPESSSSMVSSNGTLMGAPSVVRG
ncbi:hypothetical protein GCM10009812_22350 [Nocardioides marinus]